MNAKRWLAVAALLWLAAVGPARAACPQRLITLGGDITETVFALGAGDCVVADDTTSDYPPAAAHLSKVGYLRTLNAEGVLALRPDKIIASGDAGPLSVIEQLRAAGVEVVLIPERHTAVGAIAKIEAVAKTLDRAPAGKRLAASLRATLVALKRQLATVTQRKRVVFLLTVGSGSPMVAGRDTAANGIITLAGGINAAGQFSGYKPLSTEAMVKLAPDVILVMSQGVVAQGGLNAVYRLPGVSLTPAGRKHRIIAMDGSFLLGFGPRLGAAACALAERLYPQLAPAVDDGGRSR